MYLRYTETRNQPIPQTIHGTGICTYMKTIKINEIHGSVYIPFVPWIRHGYLYRGFLKWWYPTTTGFPTKIDYFRVFWGYHHLRKHPYRGYDFSRIYIQYQDRTPWETLVTRTEALVSLVTFSDDSPAIGVLCYWFWWLVSGNAKGKGKNVENPIFLQTSEFAYSTFCLFFFQCHVGTPKESRTIPGWRSQSPAQKLMVWSIPFLGHTWKILATHIGMNSLRSRPFWNLYVIQLMVQKSG